MKKIYRIISSMVLVCFLLNTTTYGVDVNHPTSRHNINLATPSLLDDLLGIQHKDIGRIKLGFSAFLETVAEGRGKATLHVEDLNWIHKVKLKEDTVFHPAGMHFFTKGITPISDTLAAVKCRLKDKRGVRTYYAVFSLKKEEDSGFPMEVYTAKEWRRLKKLITEKAIVPKRELEEAEDARAIERDIEHQRYDKNVIKWLHSPENKTTPMYTPTELGIDYAEMIKEIKEKARLIVDNPEGLIPLEEREVYIAPITNEVERRLRQNKVTVVAKDGTTRQVVAFYHSSNHALHIFLNQGDIYALMHNIVSAHLVRESIKDRLAHEIGVILDCPILEFNGRPINEVDHRYLQAVSPERVPPILEALAPDKRPPLEPKRYSIADLDTNLLTRDYAAGMHEADLEMAKKVIALSPTVHDLVTYTKERRFTVSQFLTGYEQISHRHGWEGLSREQAKRLLDKLVEEDVLKDVTIPDTEEKIYEFVRDSNGIVLLQSLGIKAFPGRVAEVTEQHKKDALDVIKLSPHIQNAIREKDGYFTINTVFAGTEWIQDFKDGWEEVRKAHLELGLPSIIGISDGPILDIFKALEKDGYVSIEVPKDTKIDPYVKCRLTEKFDDEILHPETAGIAEPGTLTQKEATERLNALPVIGNFDRLLAYHDHVTSQVDNISYREVLSTLAADLEEMDKILRAVRPRDELNGLLKKDLGITDRQLDILRGISELVLQFVEEKEGVDNNSRLRKIKKTFVKNPEISNLLIDYFETKFNPKIKNTALRGRMAAKIREKIGQKTMRLTGEEHYILQLALGIIIATVRTDYYVKERTELFFRMEPRVLLPFDHSGILKYAPPYALIWVHVPYGVYGPQARYADVARGGLRRISPESTDLRNKVLIMCNALAFTQDMKHMKIPEGGSKGTYIYEEGLNEIVAGIAYIDGLISCMKRHPRIVTAAGSPEEVDPLELGPDVGTSDLSSLASARAWQKGLKIWRLLMSGKLAVFGGVSHMSNNLLIPPRRGNRVTSQGVWRHGVPLVRYLRHIGRIKSKEDHPLRISATGNMTGDVASGNVEIAIHNYGDKAKILSLNGSSVVAYDPEGFDNNELLRLYEKKSSIANFPEDKLHKSGFIFIVKKGDNEDCYVELGPETLDFMNTRALDPDVLEGLGVDQDRYRKEAGLKSEEPLVIVEERYKSGEKKGQPKRVKVHGVYLREIIFFLVKSDILVTGGVGKDLINKDNLQLFFDWDGNPTAPAILHGANVFISDEANDKLEEHGVFVWPDEKSNSVGVEISSRVEIDFNTLFELEEVTPELMRSYFEQVLGKCLENAERTFWSLLLEKIEKPEEYVVTGLSPMMSEEVIRLADMIRDSELVGSKEEDYHPRVRRLMRNYFPDVSNLDREYTTSTLGRVFSRMPAKRIIAIAAKMVANEIVINLGIGYLGELTEKTGKETIDIVKEFLAVSQEQNFTEKQREIFENERNLTPEEQLAELKKLREQLRAALRQHLTDKSDREDTPAPSDNPGEGKAVSEMEKLAWEVGIEIAPPVHRSTLFLSNHFYKKEEEFDADANNDRFNLMRIGTDRSNEIIPWVIREVHQLSLDPNSVIVQLPRQFRDAQYKDELEKLTKLGIKFMIINTDGMNNIRDKDERAKRRWEIYLMMALARVIDKDTPKDSKLYRLLRFFISKHFDVEESETTLDEYMKGLMRNDAALLIKAALSYRPAVPEDLREEYDRIIEVLIRA